MDYELTDNPTIDSALINARPIAVKPTRLALSAHNPLKTH